MAEALPFDDRGGLEPAVPHLRHPGQVDRSPRRATTIQSLDRVARILEWTRT